MVEHDHCLSVITSKSSDNSNKVIPEDLEDGPLFRATIKELESRTSTLKLHLKRILKTATASLEAEQGLLVQDKTLIDTLKEAPFTEPLFTHYLDDTWGKLHEQRDRLVLSMQSLLISPLQKVYDMDIKTADQKRRQFEETSKDYYAYLSKYLSIKSPKKKRSEDTEAKFLNKKRDFDLIRFDYYSFLMDLHGGKKQQEILYHLSSHYEEQYHHYQSTAKTLAAFKEGLDALGNIMQEASREQTVVHKERNEKRKMLESKYCPQSPLSSLFYHEEEPVALGISVSSPDPYLKFKNIRDLEQPESQYAYGRRKEGFLFATAKPIKNNNAFDMPAAVHWHKYWCVLSGGQLHEYSNWKRHLETHNEPIHLRCAAVREARNADRRFCFEIITPQFKRIYQATSNEELTCWIATINNAISSLLNGMNDSSADFNQNDNAKATTKWKHNRSLSGALSGLTAAKEKYLKKRQRNQSANAGSPIIIDPPAPDFSLLNKLRQHDVSNTYCADCSTRNPEWCSLNLGIVICIECSGIHRSLGTHISKVRSLLLDSASFTFDIVQLLFAIGNATSNEIYEYGFKEKKPRPGDTREMKLKFIWAKYASKQFVKPSEEGADALLFEAIDTNDIPKALHAMALNVNVNKPALHHPCISLLSDSHTLSLPMLDSHGNEYLDRTLEVEYISDLNREHYTVRYPLHFALLHGCPKPSESHHSRNSSSSSGSNRSSYFSPVEDTSRVFAMAEFLFQNGADVYIKDEATGRLLADLIGLGSVVQDDAIEYLNMKNGLRGQSPITRTNAHLVAS
ncbi:ArfGap-domain-containing protein [Backusella circina FSU 941]|nr:ArfGap-domain-containing protein [Backusella circina FSU 941]